MTNQETPLNNAADSAATSLGEQFRQAREALNLSLDDVSKKINLRPSILQHIENNEFIHVAIPATFMRGYVRNYARFLRLPESVLSGIEANYGDMPKNDLTKNTRTHKAVNRYSSHNRWISYLTVIILLAVAGMTALWWWENYQQSNAERDNLVETYVSNEQSQQVPVASPTEISAQPEPQANNGETNVAAQISNNNAQSLSLDSNLSPTNLDNTNVASTEAANPAPVSADLPATSTAALQTEMDKIGGLAPEQKAETNAVPSAEQNTQADNSANASNANDATVSADLKIEVTGANCWISVKNKHRKLLAQKEYKQGEVLTFNEQDGYSLIIGAPSNVKITYKGADFPLKVDGRVAKFKLPQ